MLMGGKMAHHCVGQVGVEEMHVNTPTTSCERAVL